MTPHHLTPGHNLYLLVFIAFIAAIAGLLFGFDTGIISGALQFIVTTFHLTASQTWLKEFIVASVPLGAFIGSVFSRASSFWIGRRRSIISTALIFIIGTLVAALAQDVPMLIVGRLLMGLAIGLSAMIVPMYLSEISPPQLRGAIVFCFQLAITIGLLMAFIINYAFSAHGDWRMMFAIGIIPSIILGVGMLFLPFSPRWLVLKGKHKLAHKTLTRLRGHDDVMAELEEIKETISHVRGGVKDLFSKRLRKVLIICLGLFMFQQLSGINTMMYYAPTIYQHAGFAGAHGQILASIADGVVFVLATLLGIWAVDRLGRRPLFFIGFVGMILCLTSLGITYAHPTSGLTPTISLCAVLGYILFFGISLGPLCYLMMSELFPLNVRSTGMAMASCSNWAFNVLVSATFLTLVDRLGIGHTFYLYAALTTLGLIFTFYLVPETKGKSLEEIEASILHVPLHGENPA